MFKLNETVHIKNEYIENFRELHACSAQQYISNTYRVITNYEPVDCFYIQCFGCGRLFTIREDWLQENNKAYDIWLELEDKLRECYDDKAQ